MLHGVGVCLEARIDAKRSARSIVVTHNPWRSNATKGNVESLLFSDCHRNIVVRPSNGHHYQCHRRTSLAWLLQARPRLQMTLHF